MTQLSDEIDEEGEDSGQQWLNHYRCPRCRKHWVDIWDCQCDDDCPRCGCRHVSPFRSVEVD